jgi:hypothetical protein
MTECFGGCEKHLTISRGKASAEWIWIAGPDTGYPAFCSRACLIRYVNSEAFKV